jgi:hypothetical protein
MPYRITNRTNETVLVRLLSGRTIHLAAGAETDELDGAEINGNPRLFSLLERRLVTMEGSGASRSPAPAKKTAKKTAKKAAKKAAPASSSSSGRRSRKSAASTGGTK